MTYKDICACRREVREIVTRTLSVAHRDTIYGGSEFGLMNFTEEQIVAKMTELYDKQSEGRVKELKAIIDRPYRSAADNLNAHIAQNLHAVTELARLRGEPLPNYEALRSSIQQAQLSDDLRKHYDYDNRALSERTYATLTAHLTKHAEGVMANDGEVYPSSLAHAVVGSGDGNALVAAMMAAFVTNPELHCVLAAVQASQLKVAGGGAAPPAAPATTQRPVPQPKLVPATIKYCFVHGCSLANSGHSSGECTKMMANNPVTNKPYTAYQKSAVAHTINGNGSANGSYAGFGKV